MSATASDPQPRFWQRRRHPKPPPPLDATLLRHPVKWLKNKALLLVDGLVLLHVGTLIVAALYYLAFEVIPGVKYDWDHALTGGLHFWGLHVHLALLSTAEWNHWRHLIRNVGEGLLGGVLAQAVIWNHFKRRSQRRNRVDRLEIALHIPNLKDERPTSGWQMLALPLLILLYAIPGFAIGAVVAHIVQAHVHVNQISSQVVVQSLWTDHVSQKIVGLFASLVFARRVGRGVYDDMQLFFAERRRASGKPLASYHKLLPTFAARYNSITVEEAAAAADARDRWVTWIFVGLIPVGVGLALFGFYVLTFIATGNAL